MTQPSDPFTSAQGLIGTSCMPSDFGLFAVQESGDNH